MEAVTHALRWTASRGDSHTTHAIILTDSTEWEAQIGMCHFSTSTLDKSCECTVLDMPESKKIIIIIIIIVKT